MKVDDPLTSAIIQAVIKVHKVLGPGFTESIYRRALLIELRKQNFAVGTEVEVNIAYEGQTVGQYRLDIIVERTVIVELKAVEKLAAIHYAQVRSYLQATGLMVALLVNFSTEMADYRRIERD
ncbi:MAG TPA: GxxExxY protein [Stellaceae bacterium]|nr:GxxExxY protein [Stellaceae bacterium]